MPSLLRLWYHESCRVFQDRLVNDADRNWFDDLCKQKMKDDFQMEFDTVVTQTPLLYGDFMTGDSGTYEEITDHTKVSSLQRNGDSAGSCRVRL